MTPMRGFDPNERNATKRVIVPIATTTVPATRTMISAR